jgi:hypothetical protein
MAHVRRSATKEVFCGYGRQRLGRYEQDKAQSQWKYFSDDIVLNLVTDSGHWKYHKYNVRP